MMNVVTLRNFSKRLTRQAYMYCFKISKFKTINDCGNTLYQFNYKGQWRDDESSAQVKMISHSIIIRLNF